MQFDKIIMNPPYDRNLHLKILNETSNFSNRIVTLQPDKWITNKFNFYENTKFENKIRNLFLNKIKDSDKITVDEFNKIFNTNNFYGVGIFNFIIDGNFSHEVYYTKMDRIVEKILKKCSSCESLRQQFTRDKGINFLKIRRNNHGKLSWIGDKYCKAVEGINFDNKIQLENFKESLNLKIFKLLDSYEWAGKENCAKRPWLEDYNTKWTDEDLYKFFNLTKEEIQLIEKEVGK